MVSDENISQVDTGKEVKNRLIDAAERLFYEKGFDGTTIRDITSEAKCNVAAVNYHFGGKDKLYLEVFNRYLTGLAHIRIAGINKVMSQNDGNVSLEQLLGAFATVFIEPLISESSGQRFMKLMVREMVNPHLPVSLFVEKMILPIQTVLQQALMQVCPGLEQEKAALSIYSVIAQLIHVVHVQKISAQADDIPLPKFDLAKTVEHIVAFSAAGIRAAVKEKRI